MIEQLRCRTNWQNCLRHTVGQHGCATSLVSGSCVVDHQMMNDYVLPGCPPFDQLPARLEVKAVAVLLAFSASDIPVLIAAGLVETFRQTGSQRT